MRQNIEQAVNMDLEVYEDLIFNKTIAEMEDPVLSPYTGHVYDRIDLVNWISQSRNATDPIARDMPLTEAILVPGRFVRQIDEAAQRNIQMLMNSFDQRINAAVNEAVTTLREELRSERIQHQRERAEDQQEWFRDRISFNQQLSTLREEVRVLTVSNDSYKAENKLLQVTIDELTKQMAILKAENAHYKSIGTTPSANDDKWRLKYLETSKELACVKSAQKLWRRYGGNIDAKLLKGSTPERHEALQNYAKRIKNATTREELKAAVKDIDVFNQSLISEPRFFSACVLQGATSRSAIEFKTEVCNRKGW